MFVRRFSPQQTAAEAGRPAAAGAGRIRNIFPGTLCGCH